MVEQTKPHPAPYLLAAELLGAKPQECVAVEDSVSGVRSALDAGMHVLQLRATATAAAVVPGVASELQGLEEFPFALVGCR
jgi:beta-phosphoglucomutase-like phosphatase (HAD superfamily)